MIAVIVGLAFAERADGQPARIDSPGDHHRSPGTTTTEGNTMNRSTTLALSLLLGTSATAAGLPAHAAGDPVVDPSAYVIRHVDTTRDVGAWLKSADPLQVNATAGSKAGAKIDAARPDDTYVVNGYGTFRVVAITLSSALPSKAASSSKVGWDLRLHTAGSDQYAFLSES